MANILQKKLGPLPVVAWLGVAGGAFVVAWYLRSRRPKEQPLADDATLQTNDAAMMPYGVGPPQYAPPYAWSDTDGGNPGGSIGLPQRVDIVITQPGVPSPTPPGSGGPSQPIAGPPVGYKQGTTIALPGETWWNYWTRRLQYIRTNLAAAKQPESKAYWQKVHDDAGRARDAYRTVGASSVSVAKVVTGDRLPATVTAVVAESPRIERS